MFLNEVALGKEKTITKDDSSLKKAPAGFDSVVARGTVEPGTVLSRLYSFRYKQPLSTEVGLSCSFIKPKP